MFNFWKKKSIGLEIADRSIEVVELNQDRKNTFKILKKNRIKIRPGIVERGEIKNQEKLNQLVKKAFSQEGIPLNKEVIFGLPEAQCFLNTFVIPKDNEKELLIQEKIKENIPYPLEKLVYSYQVLDEGKNEERVIVASTLKSVLKKWSDFFKKEKINVRIFDVEPLAIFRGLVIEKKDRPICLIDMGAVTTNISFFDEAGLKYNYNILKAGTFFDKVIAKELNISLEEAEKKKLTSDLNDQGEVNFILRREIKDLFSSEIKTKIDHFEEMSGKEIKSVLLVGGSSKMKGLIDLISYLINKKIVLISSHLKKRNIDIVFAEAIGLALRGIEKHYKKEPYFKISK
jgi:type IV pilus assembly protein PilM